MTNQDSGDARLSKFSNANRRAFQSSAPGNPPADPPLANLLETAIRSGIAEHSSRSDQAEAEVSDTARDRLLEELSQAQEQIWSEPPASQPLSVGEPPLALFEPESPALALEAEEPVFAYDRAQETQVQPAEPAMTFEDAETPAERRSGPAGLAKTVLDASNALSRRVRIRDWRRRRLALLSVVHRRVFDRSAEQLLFCKSEPLEVYRVEDTEDGPEKHYVYKGPIPKKLLEWALSALPDDLKRYAFVDFRAGNGRTMLLAARRNFEFAAGYAFDAEGAETLEMNLAQYPRSYLSCRDVRALRADRDGLVIPPQPAVLFFPDSLSSAHLDIVLSYVLGSFRLEPRPIYLIFENAGRELGNESMEIFERAWPTMFTQAKALLLAPIEVAVYRSKVENSK
jgi:hypothetical protein